MTLLGYSLSEQVPLLTKGTFNIMTNFILDEFVINTEWMIPRLALRNRARL